MKNKLFYRNKSIIGLDISQTSIKVMDIDAEKWAVRGYGSLDLDPQKMLDALDGDGAYILEKLKELLANKTIGTLHSNYAVLGVPTARTYVRTFSLPVSAQKNMKDAIALEVEQYIPMPLSALYVDYEVIKRTKDTLTILMYAVPQKLIDDLLALVREAGLEVIMIEPGISAVARVLKATEEGQLPTVIVDIGPTATDIAILDGELRVTGGIAVGGNTFTLSLAKKLNISLENAHQYKVLNGLNPGPRQAKISAALKPDLQRITREVQRVIRYYTERFTTEQKLEQVLIVGAGSNMPGIGEFFTNDLIMPARVASPWQKLNFTQVKEPARQFKSRYITVAGLASIKESEVWND